MGPDTVGVHASGGRRAGLHALRACLLTFLLAGSIGALLASLALPARADPADSVQLVETWGEVWLLERARAGWTPASPGQPLQVGDRIATGPGARAVVHAEGVALRIDSSSEVERIAPGRALRVQLLAGRLALHVDAVAARSVQVLTPQGRVLPLAAGHFRVDRVADATVVEALSGRADFETGRELRSVHAGQRLAFWRDHAGHLRADVVTMTPDDFGRWLLAVPPVASRPWAAARPGWAHGHERERIEIEVHRGWVSHPGPGKPRVSPRDGRWVWMSPWGWVWVPERKRGWLPPPHPGARPPLHEWRWDDRDKGDRRWDDRRWCDRRWCDRRWDDRRWDSRRWDDRRWDDRRWDDRRWDDRRWDDRRWDGRRWDDRRWDDRRGHGPGLRDPSSRVPTPRPPPRDRAQQHPRDEGQSRGGLSGYFPLPLPRPAPEERRRDAPPPASGFSH